MNTETLSTNQDVTEQEVLEQSAAIPEMAEEMPEEMPEEMSELEEYLSKDKYDYQMPQRGDIYDGIVIEVSKRGAIVDAGFKRDGLVQAEDLDRLDEETLDSIQVGATIPVSVDQPHDQEGRLILSIYHALVQEDWHQAEDMMENGKLYEGEISGYNRGGLLVPFGRIRGFVPASHVVGMPRGLKGEERRQRLADMVGEEVGLKIIEVDRQRRRLILSQRQARRAWQKLQRERVMEELTEGEVAHGTVTGITDFGAFVDLGGADGLIHISELSWKQVDDPREVVNIGQEVDVYILDLDWKRKRIALSLKRLKPNPWTQVDEHYHEGQLVEGQVTRVLDFGAFVELDIGVEGLLHVSEMSGTSELSPSEIVRSGEKMLVKIISIDSYKERIALSARQVHRDEWEQWMAESLAASPEDEEKAKEETEEVKEETKKETEKPVEEKAEAEPAEADEPVEADEEKVTTEPVAEAEPAEEAGPKEEVKVEAPEETEEEEKEEEAEAPSETSEEEPQEQESTESAEEAEDPTGTEEESDDTE